LLLNLFVTPYTNKNYFSKDCKGEILSLNLLSVKSIDYILLFYKLEFEVRSLYFVNKREVDNILKETKE